MRENGKYGHGKLEATRLKASLNCPPRMPTMAISTSAINKMIRAYSTRPCPSSFPIKHISSTSFHKRLCDNSRMNLFFAPSFMLLHRITDGFIEQSKGHIFDLHHVKLKSVIDTIDFQYFFSFVIFKTIPLFWIPAHTITFLLPENYRVLMAAYLSIALGLILTFAKQRQTKNN